MSDAIKLSGYGDWLSDLKQQIKNSHIKAVLAVNSQLILLYWNLGRQIVEKQENTKWGTGLIEQLSKDLRQEFPDMSGLSRRNLSNIRNFYAFYQDYSNQESEIWKQPVAKLSDDANQVISQPLMKLEVSDKQENVFLPQTGGKWGQVVSRLTLIPWGLLLCKNKDNYEVEFALKDLNKPIGVSAYRYTELTREVQQALPSAEEIEEELRKFEMDNKQYNDLQ